MHDNRKRFAKTFSKHWLRYTLVIGDNVVWSGNDPKEVPDDTIRDLADNAGSMSLYSMLMTIAKAVK